jgi:FHS family L-fucose permease-like MFS transporter
MPTANRHAGAIALLTLLFFMWGFITCLNDILIPHFKQVFIVSYFESSLVQFAFFGAYFIGSLIYFIISSVYSDPINRIGYKNGILLGLLISAIGAFLFYPAAVLVSFGFFLVALFVLALGFTLLQIAANPYVAILGNPETASHRLNLSQAFNSFGTTIAPIIGGIFILARHNGLGLDSVKLPYLVFGGIFLLLTIVFKMSKLPEFSRDEIAEKGMGALKHPQLVLGIIAIFFYVGGEVSTGSFLNSFVGLPEIKGLSTEQATVYVSLYWGSLMIGRFTASVAVFNFSKVMKNILTVVVPFITFFFILWIFRIKGENIDGMYDYLIYIALAVLAFFTGQSKPSRTLLLFSCICIVLLIISQFATREAALWTVISLGLYNSIMWPVIFTLAITGLGKYTSQGSSLLVMAILGGALIPPLQGFIADRKGLHFSFIVPVICYAYLAFYGWKVKRILKQYPGI